MKSHRSIPAALFLLLVLAVALLAVTASASGRSLAGTKVCIDPGHGGADPGAVNEAFNLHESDINLDVSLALGALLAQEEAEVVFTRTGNTYLTNRDRYTFCNVQQATILVSVHTNSSTNQAIDGSLVLYFQDDDKQLAQAVYNVMYPSLGANAPGEFTGFGLERFASGVLMKSDMPAAMMEPLFMSNPGEAELLQESAGGVPDCSGTPSRRGEIACAMREGVLAYFAGLEPTPTPPVPGGTMHVSAVDMSYETKGPNRFVLTQVTVVDENNVPVLEAVVSLETEQPDGSLQTGTSQTGADGLAMFSVRSRQSGTYVSTVLQVSKDGWDYDPGANLETSESLDVP